MLILENWYVAIFSKDLGPGQRIGRKLLNQPIVIYRADSGKVYALEDRCSHRAMPLSAGIVEGEIIRCAYHGVEFGDGGECKKIPNQSRIPSKANIRSYPIVERDELVWIWMGNPANANPDLIISNPEHVDPSWTWRHYDFHVKTNWQLLVDNIMDLTHVPYIHANTIGGNPEQHFEAQMEIKADSKKVGMHRRMPNSVPPKTYIEAGGFKGRVDRWQDVEFEPGRGMVLRVNAGGCDVGTGAYEGKREHCFTLVNVHCVTPETENTTHYMWSICTNAPPETGAPEILFDQFFDTIKEDEDTLEAQQLRINDDPDRPFIGMAGDGAVNHARNLLEKMRVLEEAST